MIQLTITNGFTIKNIFTSIAYAGARHDHGMDIHHNEVSTTSKEQGLGVGIINQYLFANT